MLGTVVNALAVAVGGAVGLLFKNIIPEEITEALLKALMGKFKRFERRF